MISEYLFVPITESDVPLLMEIFADVETRRFLPELTDVLRQEEDVLYFINNIKDSQAKGESVFWGIRQENNLVGFIGIIGIDHYPSLFYALHPRYRGRGIMTACARKAVKWFQEEHPDMTLHTEVYKDNHSSLTLLKSVGFKEKCESDPKIFLEIDRKI